MKENTNPILPEEEKNEKKQDNKGTKRLIVVAIILLLLLPTVIFCFFGNGGADGDGLRIWDITRGEEVLDGDRESLSEEEIIAELNRKVEEGMINISMNLTPTFASGTEIGNLFIKNSTINHYPQVIEIIRDDTGEVIYTSSGIPVGSRVDYDTLDVDLDAGFYECTAYFNAIDPETNTCIGKAAARVLLTVLE